MCACVRAYVFVRARVRVRVIDQYDNLLDRNHKIFLVIHIFGVTTHTFHNLSPN